MKFTSTTLTTTSSIAALVLLSSSMASGMVSPYVTCCEDNGGRYETLTNSDGSESGFCKKNGQNLDEVAFYNQYCAPSPTEAPVIDYKFEVYTVNNCGRRSTVEATFNLNARRRHFWSDSVTVDYGECAFVGGTNLDSVSYSATGSYVAGGNASCQNIGNSNDEMCNLLGMAPNSCVIELC